MGSMQICAVLLCFMLLGLDGFDIISVSFAAPGIAREWGIDRGALGIVLSMELIGMAVGSIILGWAADRVGRRPIILLCLCTIAAGMFAAALAPDIDVLLAARFLTGLGIGGMLACLNAIVAEYSNRRFRNLAIMTMSAGFPIGATIGGVVASRMLQTMDWRAVFLLGAVATAALLPCTWLLLPESVASLVSRRPPGALEKINAILTRFGHSTVEALPPVAAQAAVGGYRKLFGPALIRTTVLLTIAYFAQTVTFYYIIKWIPKLVVDMGYPPSAAGGVLVWANLGGACGAVMLGILSRKFDLRRPAVVAMAASFLLVSYFGTGQATLAELSMISAVAGFFTNAAVVGIYALLAQYFSADVRAGGTGIVIGFGRGGAALGPIVAGYMFEAQLGLQVVSIVMAAGSVVALFALLRLGPVPALPASPGSTE